MGNFADVSFLEVGCLIVQKDLILSPLELIYFYHGYLDLQPGHFSHNM